MIDKTKTSTPSSSSASSSREGKSGLNKPSSSPHIPPHTIENLTVTPYEPFYLSSSNEKDVGVVLKNLKNVVYFKTSPEQMSQSKVLKVCSFDLKEKSAPSPINK